MTDLEETRRLLRRSRTEQKPLTIVLTGCSSGIGLHACTLLRSVCPQSRLFVVARNHEKAMVAKMQLLGGNLKDGNIVPMVCDHSCLKNVEAFCSDLRNHLQRKCPSDNACGRPGIDVLCLNAGILLAEDAEAEFTKDNLEITFQTNHLAPFLIANLLFDLINPGGRVVVTTSGLHAFAKFDRFAGMCDAETGHVNRKFETIDGSTFNHKKSYAASKLCNVAFCLELNRRLQDRQAVAVCFTPGLIPASGLFRHQKNWKETVLKKQAVGMDESIEWGGSFLAWMILSDEAGKQGGAYWRAPFGISKRGGKIPDDLFCAPLNDEARNMKNRETLWKLSADIAGLPLDFVPLTIE